MCLISKQVFFVISQWTRISLGSVSLIWFHIWWVGLIGVIGLGEIFSRGCGFCCSIINCCKSVREGA